MSGTAEYIYSITAAGLFCGIVTGLLKGTGIYSVVKLICGMFLAVQILLPLGGISLSDITAIPYSFEADGSVYADAGTGSSRNEMGRIISDRVRTYILDIADSMNLDLRVDVILSDEFPPVPESVRITGEITPYAKVQLEEIIAQELNIPKENQIWIG